MKKAYVYRIYPGKNHEAKMDRTLSTCRHLYNDALSERKKQAELNKLKRDFQVFPWGKPEWIRYEDQANYLSETKTPLQREVHSQVLQNVLKRLDMSFKNFFNGFGYPRFKGRNRYDSFTYPQSGFKLSEGKLTLSRIGNIKIVLHREIEGKLKTCTIKKDVDQWYAIFTVEIEQKVEKMPVETQSKIGIDVGLNSLLTLSNGKQIEPPKFLVASEKRLKRVQIGLSHKKFGTKNRGKHRIRVAKVHRKIRNQRKNFAHKTSRWLVNTYDHIVFEDLQIQNMMANHHLAKAISDAGWYQLISFTKSKAEYAGKIVELVNPKGTSQECICGCSVPKDISVRIHNCPDCGRIVGRDHMSAMLIESRSTVGTTGIKACQSTLDREMMKQEATLIVGW